MLLKFEVNDEIVDKMVINRLKESVDYVKQDVKNLKLLKNKKDYQKQDLQDSIEILEALEKIYDYYGGNLR